MEESNRKLFETWLQTRMETNKLMRRYLNRFSDMHMRLIIHWQKNKDEVVSREFSLPPNAICQDLIDSVRTSNAFKYENHEDSNIRHVRRVHCTHELTMNTLVFESNALNIAEFWVW